MEGRRMGWVSDPPSPRLRRDRARGLFFALVAADGVGDGFEGAGEEVHVGSGGAFHGCMAAGADAATLGGHDGGDFLRIARFPEGAFGALDVEIRGGGDGGFIRAEEHEVPVVFFLLVADAVGDILPRIAGRGVFVAVRHDADDDGAGALFLRQSGKAGARLIDGGADGIQQSGAAVRVVIFLGERCHLAHITGLQGFVHVVAEGVERHASGALPFFLLVDETVERRNHGGLQAAHGTGFIHDEHKIR